MSEQLQHMLIGVLLFLVGYLIVWGVIRAGGNLLQDFVLREIRERDSFHERIGGGAYALKYKLNTVEEQRMSDTKLLLAKQQELDQRVNALMEHKTAIASLDQNAQDSAKAIESIVQEIGKDREEISALQTNARQQMHETVKVQQMHAAVMAKCNDMLVGQQAAKKPATRKRTR